mgnify:FL=1
MDTFIDEYFWSINSKKLSPLIVEVERSRINELRTSITDRNGITLCCKRELPLDHEGFHKVVDDVWKEITEHAMVELQKRGYEVILKNPGKVTCMNY